MKNLIKTSIWALNFSTESAEKPTVFDFLFLVAIYTPKNVNKHPSEMRNKHESNYFAITEVFPGLGPILKTGLKCWLAVKFLHIFFFLQNVPEKIQVSQAQNNLFVFQEAAAYKRQGRADLLFWMMVNKASTHLYTLGDNIYIRTNSPTTIFLFIVNNSNTRKRSEICLKLTLKAPEWRSTVFIVNIENISHIFLVFLLLTLKK